MSVSIALTVTITPYMERKEGTGECGKCVMGGVKGESASSGTPGI